MSKAHDPTGHIKKIYVQESCHQYPYTSEILKRAGNIKVEKIGDNESPAIKDLPSFPYSFKEGKQRLLLTCNKGPFFKPCPGTREYCCCDYQILNTGMNCPMDCVYCILQAYLNNPWLTFFVNIDDLLTELDLILGRTNQFWRIGTGEFTDSMALDSLTGLSRVLVNFFKDKKNAVLELKSKSAVVENLKGLDHGGRTVMAWSLNSPVIAAREELRTASLEERLAAASRCADWGYKLAFHFDPIIYHKDWKEGYSYIIRELFNKIPSEPIVWISLGALRYLPQLRPVALRRFPGSRFFQEEFITGLDNKFRYFRSLRVEMYKHILKELRKFVAPDTCIYFCMESEEIWRECGFSTYEARNLPQNLDRAVRS
ncbi:MAG: radical SAM protein [Desulfurivibrionaceae bacterium]